MCINIWHLTYDDAYILYAYVFHGGRKCMLIDKPCGIKQIPIAHLLHKLNCVYRKTQPFNYREKNTFFNHFHHHFIVMLVNWYNLHLFSKGWWCYHVEMITLKYYANTFRAVCVMYMTNACVPGCFDRLGKN